MIFEIVFFEEIFLQPSIVKILNILKSINYYNIEGSDQNVHRYHFNHIK